MIETEQPKAVLAIREALTRTGGSNSAEKQLAIIGDEQGDEQLALVVAELQPGEVAAIAGNGDYTKPSTLVHFVSAEQFIGALERIGASWGTIDKEVDIDPMKEQVEDFISSMLLATEGRQQETLLEVFFADELGCHICVMLSSSNALSTVTEDGFCASFEVGTWQELFAIAHEKHGASFREMVKTLEGFREKVTDVEDEANSDERRGNKRESHARRTLRKLVRLAQGHVQTEPKTTDDHKPGEGFTEI